jgi:subtilisin family serine protease
MTSILITSQLLAAFFSIIGHSSEAEQPYYFDKLQIESAWKLSRGSADISVAVISTGVSHQYFDTKNLKLNAGESGNGFETDGLDNDGNGYSDDVYGANTLSGNGDPNDLNGVGTHSASVIASSGFGLAPNVKLVPVAVLNEQGAGSMEAVVKGLQYAASREVNLIYLGLSGSGAKDHYEKACEVLKNINIPVIAGAGNDAQDFDSSEREFYFPQDCDASNLFLVTSVDENDKLSPWGNFGKGTIHAAAPGKTIWGISNNGRPTKKSGTSMAAAVATGVAALVLSLHPEYSPEQLFQALTSSVDHSEELTEKTISGGRLNAHQALIAQVK